MRVKPRWWIGAAVLLAYASWVVAVWSCQGIDYKTIGAEANLFRAIIQPLGLAALALVAFTQWAGWWRATLVEHPRVVRPGLLTWQLFLMLGFIGISFPAMDWTAVTARYLLLLAVATFLVGFCEEMVTRGILLVALRGSSRSEVWAWFGSSALFGLLHATNAFFGMGAMALLQVVLAFCIGTGLYALRRLSGSLLLPMVVHALWDFSTLASDQLHAPTTPAKLVLLIGSYLSSLGVAFVLLRQTGRPD